MTSHFIIFQRCILVGLACVLIFVDLFCHILPCIFGLPLQYQLLALLGAPAGTVVARLLGPHDSHVFNVLMRPTTKAVTRVMNKLHHSEIRKLRSKIKEIVTYGKNEYIYIYTFISSYLFWLRVEVEPGTEFTGQPPLLPGQGVKESRIDLRRSHMLHPFSLLSFLPSPNVFQVAVIMSQEMSRVLSDIISVLI